MAGPKEDANVADLAWLTERKLANIPQWDFIRILKEVRQLNEEGHVGSTKFQENTTCELAVPPPAN
jgi:hypothetical protein